MPYFDNFVRIYPATSTTNVIAPPSAGTIDLSLKASDSSTNTLVIQNSGGTSVSAFDFAGKLGIGNTAPGALLDIGLAGTTLGTLRLEGNTSGYVQLQSSAAAGSWTMTLPTGAGSSGQVLKTDGTGITSWGTDGVTVSSQVFTGSGTYTPTSGIAYAIVEVVGGGGGGGGVVTASSSNNATIGTGGGGGGYSRKVVSAASIGASQTITIGAGGTAGANTGGTGGTGGTSSFGAILSATGGVGGTGMAAQASITTTGIAAVGGAGGIGSGGDFNTSGTYGGMSNATTKAGNSGRGGNSIYGAGAQENIFITTQATTTGINGLTYGGGASGATSFSTGGSPGAAAGGVGGAGIVIVTEYK